MKIAIRAVAASLALGSGALAAAAPAAAGEAFVGVYKHDVTFIGSAIGLGAAGREDGVDVHLGYRTNKLETLRWLGKPQVHAMVSINSKNTSNFVAAGLDWKIDLGKPGGFYLRPGMGLAALDGTAARPMSRVATARSRRYGRSKLVVL